MCVKPFTSPELANRHSPSPLPLPSPSPAPSVPSVYFYSNAPFSHPRILPYSLPRPFSHAGCMESSHASKRSEWLPRKMKLLFPCTCGEGLYSHPCLLQQCRGRLLAAQVFKNAWQCALTGVTGVLAKRRTIKPLPHDRSITVPPFASAVLWPGVSQTPDEVGSAHGWVAKKMGWAMAYPGKSRGRACTPCQYPGNRPAQSCCAIPSHTNS
jgi:hypothetical protein